MATITSLITIGDVYLVVADGDPAAGAGTDLPNGDPVPIGSTAFINNGGIGVLYMKTGAGATAWSTFDMSPNDWALTLNLLTGATYDAPVQRFGSSNDFDVIMRRNDLEAVRLTKNSGGNPVMEFGGFLASLTNKLGFEHFNLANGRQFIETSLAYNTLSKTALCEIPHVFVQTTAAGATTVFTQAIPNNSAWRFDVSVIARQSAGSGTIGELGAWMKNFIVRAIGATVVIRQTNSMQTMTDQNSWNVTGNVAAPNFNVQVTGQASKTIDWNVKIQAMAITG